MVEGHRYPKVQWWFLLLSQKRGDEKSICKREIPLPDNSSLVSQNHGSEETWQTSSTVRVRVLLVLHIAHVSGLTHVTKTIKRIQGHLPPKTLCRGYTILSLSIVNCFFELAPSTPKPFYGFYYITVRWKTRFLSILESNLFHFRPISLLIRPYKGCKKCLRQRIRYDFCRRSLALVTRAASYHK